MSSLRARAIRLAQTNPGPVRDALIAVLKTAAFTASMTYLNWLKAKEFKVTEEEFASHMHMVVPAERLSKELQKFVRDFHFSWTMTREESEILSNAARILDTLAVPRALLEIKQKKPLFRPGRKPPTDE